MEKIVETSFFSGVHHTNEDCEANISLAMVQHQLETVKSSLFPEHLKFTHSIAEDSSKLLKFNENGGWGDLRDQILCISMTLS